MSLWIVTASLKYPLISPLGALMVSSSATIGAFL